MKKNRPAMLVTVLCNEKDEPKFREMFFSETTTLGVRSYAAERHVLAREWETVATQFGEVRIKVGRLNGHIRQASPEFEDCRKLAARDGRSSGQMGGEEEAITPGPQREIRRRC
jgi:uncharacterized protein (DUF111 family)